jgi:bifunctional ADP-heptose synthase (sugar kinase/adenylyltransferase)
VIRSYLKNKGKKLTRVNKTPSVSRVRNKPTDKIRKLVADNAQLNRFCFEWREKSDKQEKEIARLQHLYMDQLAVVRYLETKIEQLFK